jgi:hypothetical protein
VVNLEVGVNIIPETDVKELINGIYYSKKHLSMYMIQKIPITDEPKKRFRI